MLALLRTERTPAKVVIFCGAAGARGAASTIVSDLMQRLFARALAPVLVGTVLVAACGSSGGGDDDDDGGDGGGSGASDSSTGGKAGRQGAAGASGRVGSGGSGVGAEAGVTGDAGTGNDSGAGAVGGTAQGGGEGGADTAGATNGEAGTPSSGGSSGSGGSAGHGGNGGSSGQGGSSGTGGSAGQGGNSGSGCGPIAIDGISHHLGDGTETEGTTLTRSFDVSCSCTSPWLSFQIDGPSRNVPPHVYFNGSELPSIVSFYPPVSSDDVWQSNGGSSYDYNGYLQIHYDVSGKLLSGANSVTITSGTGADDYNFQDLRIECGAATTPPGPDIVNRGGWVGYYADRAGDDPAGIQGAFYAYGDGTSCTVPASVCLGAGCCIAGTTAASDPTTKWGCGMGLQLHSSGGSTPTELAYAGSANCFQLELYGSSGGSEVRVRTPNHADMTNRTAPVVSLGAITGTTTRTVCFSDFACPSDADQPCDLTSTFYKLEVNVMGGVHAGAFDVCWRSLIPFTE